jgi:uncharacterized protein YeaO (DUF488 family)
MNEYRFPGQRMQRAELEYPTMAVALKRVYDSASRNDGVRVLVDRLWPRGVKKEEAGVELWLRDIAPSDELRKWFHERPTQWLKFRERYLEELSEPPASDALEELHRLATGRKDITLLYSSKNTERNNAVVLKELLEGMRKPPRSTGSGAVSARVARRAHPNR